MSDYEQLTTDALMDMVRADPTTSARELALLSRLLGALEEIEVLTRQVAVLETSDGQDP